MSKIEIYVRDRGTGKTMRMLYISEYTGYPIVCVDGLAKNYLVDTAREYKINIPEPICANELSSLKGKNIDGVLIDELPYVTKALLEQQGLKLAAATVSDENVKF